MKKKTLVIVLIIALILTGFLIFKLTREGKADQKPQITECGNDLCESGEDEVNCPEDCEKLGLITSDSFGVQLISNEAAVAIEEIGVGYVNLDESGFWSRIEPNPPILGIHTYDWSKSDKRFEAARNSGFKIHVSLQSRSDWGTTYKEEDADEPCCDMFPIKPGYEDDWKAFVKAYVERYDDYGLVEISLGNEITAKSHFEVYGGTPENYEVIMRNAYEGAKEANPNIIVASGWASYGNYFDAGIPENGEQDSGLHSSSLLDTLAEHNRDYYDLIMTQCSGHYTSIKPIYDVLRDGVLKYGYEKPISCMHGQSTPVMRYNPPLPEYYADEDNNGEEDILEILLDTNHPDFEQSQKLLFADQSRQVIKKLTETLTSGMERIYIATSNDPYSCTLKKYTWGQLLWFHAGLIDTRQYCNTRDGLRSRKPALYSYKLFIDKVVGASKEIETLDLGSNVYAYKFMKNNKPLIVLWHENVFATDANGLVKINQIKTIDLSSYVSTSNVKITHIITELDSNWNPIYPSDETVSASSIQIDETPIFIEEL